VSGVVYLVGAGPGDPRLLTLRGAELLQRADVVVHDRLAPAALLDLAPRGAERVDAGKARGRAAISQEGINRLLIDRARRGLAVVRLKGGDPFVFGRGGEEVLACAQAGIPCSVVPGLSSVTSAPTLAGIPVTHRGVAQSFTVISGHLPPGHPDSTVDWAGLARSVETLVLLMAVGNLASIAARLLDYGRPPTMPVACIQRAATPRQRVTRCTLAELARSGAAQQVASPAVIVIGPTVPTLQGVDTDCLPDHDTATPQQEAKLRTRFGEHLDDVVSSL